MIRAQINYNISKENQFHLISFNKPKWNIPFNVIYNVRAKFCKNMTGLQALSGDLEIRSCVS